MIAYEIDEYNALVSEIRLPIDPEETKIAGKPVYLRHPRRIDVPPPEHGPNECPVWNEDHWTIVPDHRGETWFDNDGQEAFILRPGDPTEQGLSPERPEIEIPPVVMTADEKITVKAAVDALVDAGLISKAARDAVKY